MATGLLLGITVVLLPSTSSQVYVTSVNTVSSAADKTSLSSGLWLVGQTSSTHTLLALPVGVSTEASMTGTTSSVLALLLFLETSSLNLYVTPPLRTLPSEPASVGAIM